MNSMIRYTAEQVQEIVEDWEDKYNRLEEEYSCLQEDYKDYMDTVNEAYKEVYDIFKRFKKSNDELQKEYNKLLNKYYDAEKRLCALASLYIKTVTSQPDIKEERDEK